MTDKSIGLDRNKVELVPYDPQWPVLVAQESEVLKEIFSDELVSVEHFGSTAIPGIMAKPLLDILVQTKSDILSDEIIKKLEQNSYQERVFNDGVARRMFAKGSGNIRTHHVHITQANNTFAKDMLEFRDILRANPEKAKKYEELKMNLAVNFPDDRQAYYTAKVEFFETVLGRKTFQPGKG